MSTHDHPSRRVRALMLAAFGLLSIGSVGCWEQVSQEWFPQMKRQIAVQAFEYNPYAPHKGDQLMPPEGTVQVGNPYPGSCGSAAARARGSEESHPGDFDFAEERREVVRPLLLDVFTARKGGATGRSRVRRLGRARLGWCCPSAAQPASLRG